MAKALVQAIGAHRAVRIPMDYYLKPNSYPTLQEFLLHPLEYDWVLLEETLREADGTPRTTPAFDFVTFQRTATNGGRPFVLRPIVILDSIIPYPKADYSIFLDIPETERLRRVMVRDAVWKTNVAARWTQLQITLEQAKESRACFDCVLNYLAPLEKFVIEVLGIIAL